MAFPDLQRRVDPNAPDGFSALFMNGVGVPVNGANVIGIPFVDDPPLGSGLDPDDIDDDWLVIEVVPLGAGVTGASYGSISADKRFITINFQADGISQAQVTVQLIHSEIR